ncbi:MAG TPA: alpha/beta hydrolase-fold protein [Vicinamibacterales bacterium]|nr:alpha/beta hydrolase-fold protein [Vicinamibacterales bacterium]
MLRHDVPSEWISGPRRVTVWTGTEAVSGSRGPGVPGSGTPTPLLILHDGQNLFDGERAHRPGVTWQVAETAARLVEEGKIPPLVIAGIDHAAEERILEMTPTEGNHSGAGQASRYGRFVVEELVPFLEAEYGVDTRAGRLAMGGSSLGGLVTLAIAQQYPARFGRLLVMSPSLWWDEAVMLTRVRRQPFAPATRVWLDVGLKEGRQTAANVRKLRRLLLDQLDAGNVNGADDPLGDHSEDRWAKRLPEAMVWLFGS